MLPRQSILGWKWVKSADSPLFVALAFLNGIEYRNSDFKKLIYDDLATLVNFDPVTLEFKSVKGVHPVVYQQFRLRGATARPCENQFWVFWGDQYSVLFQLFARVYFVQFASWPHRGQSPPRSLTVSCLHCISETVQISFAHCCSCAGFLLLNQCFRFYYLVYPAVAFFFASIADGNLIWSLYRPWSLMRCESTV